MVFVKTDRIRGISFYVRMGKSTILLSSILPEEVRSLIVPKSFLILNTWSAWRPGSSTFSPGRKQARENAASISTRLALIVIRTKVFFWFLDSLGLRSSRHPSALVGFFLNPEPQQELHKCMDVISAFQVSLGKQSTAYLGGWGTPHHRLPS